MSTIRPLATIAILAGLGIFLAHQIQNSPIDGGIEGGDELSANLGDAPGFPMPATDTPPAFSPDAIAPPIGAAPPSAASPPPAAPAMSSAGIQGVAPDSIPALPSLPADTIPPAAPLVSAPPATTPLDDIPLPDEIAEADLSGLPPAQSDAGPLAGLPPAQPSYPSTTPPADASDPYAPYESTPIAEETAPLASGAQASGLEPSYEPLGPIGGAAALGGFDQALPAINEALARDELTRAHAMLSAWYGEPGLTAAQRRDVESLLSQLAGTVVYSTDHRLEPPYTVKPGDTLDSIAEEYNVPWRLLAKINGVSDAVSIQPGQTLKVLRGPFNAVVDAANSELVLMIDGKYAGKFAVQLSGAAKTDGQWRVNQKTVESAGAYGSAPAKLLVLTDGGSSLLAIGVAGGSPLERGRVAVAPADLEELNDILSVGSEVVIRR